MRILFLLGLVLVVIAAGCNENPSVVEKLPNKTLPNSSTVKSESSLLFEDEGLSSYSEESIRGSGVVSFQLEINDRLDIYDLDGSVFGGIVYNEDGSYFTLKMPQKTIARRLIPAQDFAAFDFDAEPVKADQDYLLVFVNKKSRKVKKASLKYTYYTWPEYLRNNTIRLKSHNLLRTPNNTIVRKSSDQIFEITAVKGDRIEIKSLRECQNDGPYQQMQGIVKWRTADELLIDFVSCN